MIVPQPHPLDQLRPAEIKSAREVILQKSPGAVIHFRSIYLEEPAKASLTTFLAAEHSGTLGPSTPRPPRLAQVHYDLVHEDRNHDYIEALVDINMRKEIQSQTFDDTCQPPLHV